MDRGLPFSSTTDRAAGNRLAALLLIGEFAHRNQITSGGPSRLSGWPLEMTAIEE